MSEESIITAVQEADFSVEELTEQVKSSAAGAVVTFLGTVRDDGVSALFYECYKEMAEKRLKEIAKYALTTYDLKKVVIVHRTGTIPLKGNVVFIGVSAPHRSGAFDACRFIIEEIKKDVPIWKSDVRE